MSSKNREAVKNLTGLDGAYWTEGELHRIQAETLRSTRSKSEHDELIEELRSTKDWRELERGVWERLSHQISGFYSTVGELATLEFWSEEKGAYTSDALDDPTIDWDRFQTRWPNGNIWIQSQKAIENDN
jgi:hypothetical protein